MRNFGADNWPCWEEYKVAIVSRFGTGPFDDPLAELMKLKQTRSVALYQEKFHMLLNRVDMSISQAVSCFLSGLSEKIQCVVRMFRPARLHEAYCLAKLQEATLAFISRRSKPILERTPTLTRTFSSYRGSVGGSSGLTYPRQPRRSTTTR